MAFGKVNIGGSSGVVKLYRLFRQSEEPLSPRKGDMWVKVTDTINKITLSVEDISVYTPTEGELYLQFTNVVQKFNFSEITSKLVGGNIDSEYIYDITTLVKKDTLSKYYMPLYKHGEVQSWAILTRMLYFKDGAWIQPEGYYYNGEEWVKMHYKVYTIDRGGNIRKYTETTLEAPQYLPIGVTTMYTTKWYLVRVMPNGDFYTQEWTSSGYNVVIVRKFDREGNLLSELRLNGTYMSGVYHIDINENIYMFKTSGYNSNTFNFSKGETRFRSMVIYNKFGNQISEINSFGAWVIPNTPSIGCWVADKLYEQNNELYMLWRNPDNQSYKEVVFDMYSLTPRSLYAPTDYSPIQYYMRSGLVMEGDYAYSFLERSSSSNVNFEIFKMQRDDFKTFKKAISNGNPNLTNKNYAGQQFIGSMIAGGAATRYWLYKIPNMDRFILVYNHYWDIMSVNMFDVDFELGYVTNSVYKTIITKVGNTSSTNTLSCVRVGNKLVMIMINMMYVVDIMTGALETSKQLDYPVDGGLNDRITQSLQYYLG